MDKEIITFGDIEIEKRKFHHCRNLILLGYVDIDSIQVSSIVSSSKKSQKCFIGYKDCDYKTKPLRITLPKTFAYIKTRMVKLNG